MKSNNRDVTIKKIVDFIGEYSRTNPGYDPQDLAASLAGEFRINGKTAEQLALRIAQEVNGDFPLAALELNLTFNCNLACEYCFIHNKQGGERMTLTTAQKAIDILFSNAGPSVNITFFGGEPLLEFDLIQAIVPYVMANARQLGKEVTWAITTNGTLVTEEILQFFAQYNIYLLLSLDGGPETHDRYRRTKSGEGTWHKIAALLPLIGKYQGWIGARMTVSTEALASMEDDFAQLVDLGINQFIIAPAQGAKQWSKEQVEQYGASMLKLMTSYRQLKQAGKNLYIEEFEKTEAAFTGWGCQAGFSSLAVAPDGAVSPCSKLLGLTAEQGKCIVGNVHSGLKQELLAPFRRPAPSQPLRCSQCVCKCHGGCYAVNYEQTGNHFIPAEENCLFWQVQQELGKTKPNI